MQYKKPNELIDYKFDQIANIKSINYETLIFIDFIRIPLINRQNYQSRKSQKNKSQINQTTLTNMYTSTHIPQNNRFSKVFKKLNSSYEQKKSTTILPQSSTENSFYGQKSIGYSEDRSLKFNTPFRPKSTKLLPVDEQSVIKVLFEQKEVLINRQRKFIKTEFIPTSNGLKYILTISESFYLNLSWLHSVQQLQKNKILVLYYDMYDLTSSQISKSPKIESLIIQFTKELEMLKLLSAINFIHKKHHDEDVQKLYHLISGDSNFK